MDVDFRITYPATPDRTFAMLTDPEFSRRARVAGTGVSGDDIDVDVREEGGRTVVETSSPVPTDLVPASARRFVPAGLRLLLTESWSAPAADGSREGDLEVRAGTMPFTLRGTQRLVGEGDRTHREVRGTLKVSIPLVGGSVERQAVGHVDQLVGLEERAAQRWFAER